MKINRQTFWLAFVAMSVSLVGSSQIAQASPQHADHDETITVVNQMMMEASCGQCQFGLDGKGCDLAVRFEGKGYYVDGVNIDELGDAHAADGMCNAIRMASVSGRVKEGRFVSTAFKMLPSTDEKLVEASCGQCHFELDGKGCDLAVRVDGKAYFVDGVDPDNLSGSHDADGICNSIRQAKVKGSVKDGRFVATSFEMLPFVKELTVEASCGACQFGLAGDGCDLAVRIDGMAMYVDGATMGDFGDAHGDAGMCNTVRSAKIKGVVNDGRFVATSFKLLPQDGAHQTKKPKFSLGIALGIDGEKIVIKDVLGDSPAEKAGLLKGDHIVKINQTELAGLERTELVDLFKKSQTLDFSIMRDGKSLALSVTLAPAEDTEHSHGDHSHGEHSDGEHDHGHDK